MKRVFSFLLIVAGLVLLTKGPLPLNAQENEEAWRQSFYHVPATEPVRESYFRDAVFIGDSRVMGLMLYSGLNEATFYTEKGINISNLLTKAIVPQGGGEKITVLQALSKGTFGKVYIKIGLNELGWPYPEIFIEKYAEAIDEIRALQPEAVFYVQSILPISQSKDEGDNIFTNKQIDKYNDLIKKMAWEKDIEYLDVAFWFKDEKGYLPEAAGHDGVHLNKEYCGIWRSYLLSHTFRDYDKVRL